MVDHPLVDGNGTMWIWASAEISDEYVWVGEEAVNVSRKASDRPYLNHTLELKQYREPLVAG